MWTHPLVWFIASSILCNTYSFDTHATHLVIVVLYNYDGVSQRRYPGVTLFRFLRRFFSSRAFILCGAKIKFFRENQIKSRKKVARALSHLTPRRKKTSRLNEPAWNEEENWHFQIGIMSEEWVPWQIVAEMVYAHFISLSRSLTHSSHWKAVSHEQQKEYSSGVNDACYENVIARPVQKTQTVWSLIYRHANDAKDGRIPWITASLMLTMRNAVFAACKYCLQLIWPSILSFAHTLLRFSTHITNFTCHRIPPRK